MRGDITKISKSALPGKIASGYSCIMLTRLRAESPVSTYHLEALRLKRAWVFLSKLLKLMEEDSRGTGVQTKMQKKTIKKRSNYACGLRSRLQRLTLSRWERETLFSGNVSICGEIKFVAQATWWVAAVIWHPCWEGGGGASPPQGQTKTCCYCGRVSLFNKNIQGWLGDMLETVLS